jgi:hypothetical protein
MATWQSFFDNTYWEISSGTEQLGIAKIWSPYENL